MQAEEEISILQRLEHENIIQYVDSFAERSAVIIVTEYLSGGELFVKIADEDYSLTEADCTHFVRQICLGNVEWPAGKKGGRDKGEE